MNRTYSLILTMLLMAFGSQFAESRSVRFLFFRAPADAPESAVMYVNGKEPVEVTFPRNNFSKPLELKKGSLLLHFLPEAIAADEEFPENAPSVKVPETWDEVLVFVSHAPKNPRMPVNIHAINAGDDQMKAGDRTFINLTDNGVFGSVGSKKLKLKPNSIVTIRNAASAGESYQVKLDRFDLDTKKRKALIRQSWKQSDTKKSLILIYSPSPGRVSYYSAPVRNY